MRLRGLVTALLIAAVAAPTAAQDKQPPYWASIASGEAMTRAGPGRTYPGLWLYKRRDLPVRVLKRYENWRLIEDPDGEQGWMLVTLLSDRRTALVKGDDPRPILTGPDASASVRYRAEPGVVGRVDRCGDGWCRISIGNKRGYVSTSDIFGVGASEVVE